MKRGHRSTYKPEGSVIDAALEAMNAEALRDIIRDVLLELDDRAHGRVVGRIIERATRNASGWTPPRTSDDAVARVVSFAEAAKRVGYADPSDVDDYLQQGASAFLGKDYTAAHQIFRALLLPISEVEIDLGQHEMVDEVLGTDVDKCSAQYVVSTYMTTEPNQRAHAVREAIAEMSGVGYMMEPLREMDRVAIDPLPGLDEFLPRWRALIEDNAKTERRNDWDTDQDRWLRDAVQRMEGADELDWMSADSDEPRLATATIHEIIDMAGEDHPLTADARNAALRAMCSAAEKRISGVTENKRRRYYAHAAQLVAACADVDQTPDTSQWVAGIRDEYRRYPALQRELNSHVGRA